MWAIRSTLWSRKTRAPILVTARNAGETAVAGELQVTVESFDGAKETFSQPTVLAAGASARLELPRARLGRGRHQVGRGQTCGRRQKAHRRGAARFRADATGGAGARRRAADALCHRLRRRFGQLQPARGAGFGACRVHLPSRWRGMGTRPSPIGIICLRGVRVHDQFGVRPYILTSSTPRWAAINPEQGNGATPRLDGLAHLAPANRRAAQRPRGRLGNLERTGHRLFQGHHRRISRNAARRPSGTQGD